MMRRRFVRHPRGYAGYRTVGLQNYDRLNTAVGVLPNNEYDLAAAGMERVVNPPLDQVLAGWAQPAELSQVSSSRKTRAN